MNTCIVIVTYNGIKWIEKCLGSCKNHEVVVVDNHSNDGTVSYIKNNFPTVKILGQQSNLGFGQANNIGISYALQQGSEHVFLLNQDAYLVEDALEQLLNFQKRHNKYGILSPIHLNGKGDELDANFSSYVSYNKNAQFYSDYVLHHDLEPVYDVPFVNAAAWLLSRKCLEEIGAFDPLFFHYGEDENYCQRVLYHGFKIGVMPKAFVCHNREDRKSLKLLPWTKFYYDLQERRYKLNFANVNDAHALDLFYKELKRLKRSIIKALFLLKVDTFKGLIKQCKMLQGLEDAITTSYTKNQIKDNHYLDL